MTTFLPGADHLVLAVADYLEEQLLPTLAGYQKFHTRVCVNALRTVVRELQQVGDLERDEHLRLCELLDQDGSLEALNAELAQRIAGGRIPLGATGLVEHLCATLCDSLAINNPRWLQES